MPVLETNIWLVGAGSQSPGHPDHLFLMAAALSMPASIFFVRVEGTVDYLKGCLPRIWRFIPRKMFIRCADFVHGYGRNWGAEDLMFLSRQSLLVGNKKAQSLIGIANEGRQASS